MKHFTFQLAVKKYVQKYFTSMYGPAIPARMETDIGFVILNTLASKLEAQVCRGYNNQFKNPYQAKLVFTLSFHYFYLIKKEVSVQTGILLNRYLENKFEEALSIHVEKCVARGGEIKQAIEEFCQLYKIGIDEDVSFDALKKMEYRSRKKNLQNNLCRLSPEQNLFSSAVA